MDISIFVFVLVFGTLFFLIISLIPFVNFLEIFIRIFPSYKPKDYKEYSDITNDDSYKNHKCKWKKILGCTPIVYALFYCAFSFLFKNILFGFYSAVIAASVYFGIVTSFERKKRK